MHRAAVEAAQRRLANPWIPYIVPQPLAEVAEQKKSDDADDNDDDDDKPVFDIDESYKCVLGFKELLGAYHEYNIVLVGHLEEQGIWCQGRCSCRRT